VGVSQDKSLVLWPDIEASCASIAGLSSRDADAYPGFVRRLHRLSASGFANGKSALVNWHLSSSGRDAQSADAGYFRGASLSRVLEEEFSTPLLRGLLAQAALQATARALHTAQMALDAMERAGGEPAELQAAVVALRDGLADAYAAMPDKVRQEVLRAPGTIGGDELLDLLATLVRAREGRTNTNPTTTPKEQRA
jgi:hypothetical protein